MYWINDSQLAETTLGRWSPTQSPQGQSRFLSGQQPEQQFGVARHALLVYLEGCADRTFLRIALHEPRFDDGAELWEVLHLVDFGFNCKRQLVVHSTPLPLCHVVGAGLATDSLYSCAGRARHEHAL